MRAMNCPRIKYAKMRDILSQRKSSVMRSNVSGTTVVLLTSSFRTTAHSSRGLADTLMSLIGYQLAKMHSVDVIHGDLTTSNMMMRNARSREATRLSQKTGNRVDSLVASLDSMRLSDGTEKELVRLSLPFYTSPLFHSLTLFLHSCSSTLASH